MDQTQLTKNPEDQGILKSKLIFLGIGALVGFAVAYLIRLLRAIPPDPPPIVIKSGSFILETNRDFTEAPVSGENEYKTTKFNTIKAIRVKRIKGSNQTEVYESEVSDKLEISIKLEEKDFGGNNWTNLGTVKCKLHDVGNQKEFKFKIKKKLNKTTFTPSPFTERWEDDGTKEIKFAEVKIDKKNSPPITLEYEEGDKFEIGFFDYLV